MKAEYQTALIADIGGTNARFALVTEDEILIQEHYKCIDFPTLNAAAQHFLTHHAKANAPRVGVFAVAGPVEGDQINLTNHPWDFSVAQVEASLNLDALEVMNDFKAVAFGVLHVDTAHIKNVYDVPKKENRPIAILGPGTGLGVASLIFANGHYAAVDGEGGHVTMPARNAREFQIFETLLLKYHHISAERVCSGKGLQNLYAAIAELDHIKAIDDLSAEEIAKRGIENSCPICAEAIDLMCAFLGRIAGNLALILKAYSGVYIAGGIPPKLGDYFFKSRFVEEYTSKGRMSDVVKNIPVYMINHPSVGMLGLQHRAAELLRVT